MLALCSNPQWLSVARAAVERLTETLGFPIAQGKSITRAVDESLTNIVRRSYGDRPDQPMAMYFRRAQRRILLCDRGPALDPCKFEGRPLDEIRPGGLGVHFIQQAMDSVEFTRKGSTNRLRLVKYLAHGSSVL